MLFSSELLQSVEEKPGARLPKNLSGALKMTQQQQGREGVRTEGLGRPFLSWWVCSGGLPSLGVSRTPEPGAAQCLELLWYWLLLRMGLLYQFTHKITVHLVLCRTLTAGPVLFEPLLVARGLCLLSQSS